MAGEREFNAALDAMVARVEAAAARTAVDSALIVQAESQRVASSGIFEHPTGTTKRSVHTEPGVTGTGAYSAKVGPSTVYSRRLELGFDGSDVLGRVYHQQPRPFMAPGRRAAIPAIDRLARRRVVEAIRGS